MPTVDSISGTVPSLIHAGSILTGPSAAPVSSGMLLVVQAGLDSVEYETVAGVTAPKTAITFNFDGHGSTIAVGTQALVQVPYGATINKASAFSAETGSVVIDLWSDVYANFPPTDADSITAAAPVTISSSDKSEDATLTGWTTAITSGDTIIASIDSITSITRLTIVLEVQMT